MDDRLAAFEAGAAARWRQGWLDGPTRTRHGSVPVQAGDAAPDLTLPDTEGKPRALSEFWANGPALIVFFRHYGCGCLADRIDALSEALDAIRATGTTVVGIGQAEPERTKAIVERRGYDFPVLADPDLVAYRAYELLQGTPNAIYHDELVWRPGDSETADKWLSGRAGSEKALVDDPWQLPGDFLVKSDGIIAHAHRAQFCEDFAPNGVLLGAIAAIAA